MTTPPLKPGDRVLAVAVVQAARSWKDAEDAFYASMLSGGYVTNAMITPLLRKRAEAERDLKRAVAALIEGEQG